MINNKYAYLVGTLLLLVIWVYFYFRRKDTRKEMLLISLIFLFTGFADVFYLKDWWHPQTVTGTVPGIESFLFAFSYPGIVAVLYEQFFRKKLRIEKLKKGKKKIKNIKFTLLFLIVIFFIFVGYYIFNLNTWQATLLSLILGTLFIWIERRDLIIDSIYSGILALVIVIPVFAFVEFLFPGAIRDAWLFENVPEIIIFYVPIDDFIYYLVVGAFIGPLYEYWQEAKLVNLKKK
jgi:hypothetical protein